MTKTSRKKIDVGTAIETGKDPEIAAGVNPTVALGGLKGVSLFREAAEI